VKHLRGSAKCGFRVYNPTLLEERINKSGKAFWILQLGDRSWKDQTSLLVCHSESFYELGAKDGTEHVHGQEEGVFRADPASKVRGESTGGNQTVNMRMEKQVLSPGVQDADEPDLRAELLGLGRDFEHSLGTASK